MLSKNPVDIRSVESVFFYVAEPTFSVAEPAFRGAAILRRTSFTHGDGDNALEATTVTDATQFE